MTGRDAPTGEDIAPHQEIHHQVYEQIHGKLRGAVIAEGSPAFWPWRIRWLHWSTALLVIAGICAVLSRDWIDDDDLAKNLLGAHRQIGITLLLLTLLRIATRLRSARPRWAQPQWARLSAGATHLAFYLMLIALPLLGWAYTNAKGKPVSLFGLPLPDLIGRNRDLAETLQTLHSTLGWTLLGLIAIHMLAALWHHWAAKDRVLRSMLGGRG